MEEPARIRIANHRLMRSASDSPEGRVSSTYSTVEERKRSRRRVFNARSKLHTFAFLISFVFATGITTLGILFFVRSSENILRLVLTGVFSGASFVSVFAWLRYVILSHPRIGRAYMDEDENEPHVSKSIAYGFVALVVALLLAGLIMKTASASGTI